MYRSERHYGLDATAARSVQRAVPLVRKSAWQRFKPHGPGEISLCIWLGAADVGLLALLAFQIFGRR